MVDFGVEPRWLVAGCELGCGEAIALGVEQAHGVLREASTVREALEEALDCRDVAPTAPLFAEGWGDPTLADRPDELLAESDFGT